MSQLRDGSRGRLSSKDGGIPVNSRAVRKPDFLRGGGGSSFMPCRVPVTVTTPRGRDKIYSAIRPGPSSEPALCSIALPYTYTAYGQQLKLQANPRTVG
jgi:hypothetical protein